MLQITIPDEVIELHRCYMYRNVMPKLQYCLQTPGEFLENVLHIFGVEKNDWFENIRLFLLVIEENFDNLAIGQCDCLYETLELLLSRYNNLLSIDENLTKLGLNKIFDYEHFSSLNELDALIEQLKCAFLVSSQASCEIRAQYTSELKLNDRQFQDFAKKQLLQYGFKENIQFTRKHLENWFKSTVIADLRQNGFHNSLLKKMKIWTPYVFAMYLDVRVCPYCNRQYITTLLTEDAKTRADIDHFKPKSKYPWLALSLYNMVLSCKTCNSAFKGISDTAWNPYTSSIAKNFRFVSDLNCEGDDVISVKIDDNQDETEQYFNDFKIREVMQNHADVVKKYKQKKLAYNNEYLDSVLQNTQNLFNNKEEMKAAIFGYIPHEEDIDKVALGKLHYDLAKEFGLREKDTDK